MKEEAQTPQEPWAGLNPKHKAWCEEYVQDFRANKAAQRAGYIGKHLSNTAADIHARPEAKAYIKYLILERRRSDEENIEQIKRELEKVAFCDASDLIAELSKDGKSIVIKDFNELPENLKASIKSFKATKDGIQVEFHSKLNAIEMLSRHYGFFELDNQQLQPTGPVVYLPDNGRETE